MIPDAYEVPSNARIFVRLAGLDSSTVALEGRGPLAFTTEAAGDELGLGLWLGPEEPLSEAVRVTASNGERSFSYGYDVVTGVDTTPPEPTEVRLEGLSDGAFCSEIAGARVVVRFPGGPSPEGVTFEVELFRDGVSLGRTFPWTAFGTSADPDCLGPGYISGLVAGETLEAVVRVWDMGGNYSEHGPFTFTVDHAEPGSARPCAICSAAPGARSSGIWLGTLAVLATVLARRRR